MEFRIVYTSRSIDDSTGVCFADKMPHRREAQVGTWCDISRRMLPLAANGEIATDVADADASRPISGWLVGFIMTMLCRHGCARHTIGG